MTSPGVHLVAYVGDADGNGAYSGADAVLISRVLLQTDVGFAAYPLVDPVIVADTDGSGFIPSDAPLQVNEAGVGVPTANLPTPPIPSGVMFHLRVADTRARAASTTVLRGPANLTSVAVLFAAAPLSGNGFQAGDALAVHLPPTAVQNPMDQVFQAWTQGSFLDGSDPAIRPPSDIWLPPRSAADGLDSLLWDEASGDAKWQDGTLRVSGPSPASAVYGG